MKNVLLIKTDMLIRSDILKKIHDSFVKQLETGVVIIPAYFEAKLLNVPDDIEVILESKGETTLKPEFIDKEFDI